MAADIFLHDHVPAAGLEEARSMGGARGVVEGLQRGQHLDRDADLLGRKAYLAFNGLYGLSGFA